MTYLGQTGDLTSQYLSFQVTEDDYRAVANTLYQPGMCVQFAAIDKQIYPDQKTVQPAGTGANQQLVIGLVSEAWPGFNGSIGAASFTSPTSTLTQRGTSGVTVKTGGYHPAALIDQSGTGGATITNQTPLVPSRATAGYMQGVATAVGGLGTAAVALLPSSGIGSSISAGALTQASQTVTIAGVPAQGDVISVTLQMPYSTAQPGVAQTTTFTCPALTSGQAASVTTAAAAVVAYLNGQVAFSTFFTASNAAGVITIAVNALASPFLVTFGSGGTVTDSIIISLSGSVGNSITISCAAVGGSTATAGAGTLASGVGYKGVIPVIVV